MDLELTFPHFWLCLDVRENPYPKQILAYLNINGQMMARIAFRILAPVFLGGGCLRLLPLQRRAGAETDRVAGRSGNAFYGLPAATERAKRNAPPTEANGAQLFTFGVRFSDGGGRKRRHAETGEGR